MAGLLEQLAGIVNGTALSEPLESSKAVELINDPIECGSIDDMVSDAKSDELEKVNILFTLRAKETDAKIHAFLLSLDPEAMSSNATAAIHLQYGELLQHDPRRTFLFAKLNDMYVSHGQENLLESTEPVCKGTICLLGKIAQGILIKQKFDSLASSFDQVSVEVNESFCLVRLINDFLPAFITHNFRDKDDILPDWALLLISRINSQPQWDAWDTYKALQYLRCSHTALLGILQQVAPDWPCTQYTHEEDDNESSTSGESVETDMSTVKEEDLEAREWLAEKNAREDQEADEWLEKD